jgi:hypothetical protein
LLFSACAFANGSDHIHIAKASQAGGANKETTYQYMKTKLDQNVNYFANYQLRIAPNIQANVLKQSKAKDMTVSSIIKAETKSHSSFRIVINKQYKIVAIAKTKAQAEALAQPNRAVYFVIEGQTLEQTIKRWASLNGYTVAWMAKDNYKMVANAVIFGKFSTPYGALDQLLQSYRNKSYPLKATLSKNNVLVITEDSYSSKFLTPKLTN